MANPPPARCVMCGAPPKGACARCGRPYCGQHGGRRWVWETNFGKPTGWLIQPARAEVCDACTPDPFWMFAAVGAAVFVLLLVGLLLTFFL
jgi:hypothetical protein